jgi:hypothetical protein
MAGTSGQVARGSGARERRQLGDALGRMARAGQYDLCHCEFNSRTAHPALEPMPAAHDKP